MKILSIALAYILIFAQVISAAPLLPTTQKVMYRGTVTGLTISAVDGTAFIDNATISALGGSVTRDNMKLSAVDGTAFVDFSALGTLTYPVTKTGTATRDNTKISAVDGTAFIDLSEAGILTDYVPDNALLTITDSAGKKLTGYIKAAGLGETLGSDLASGWDFTSGWNVGNLNTTIVDSNTFTTTTGGGVAKNLTQVASTLYQVVVQGAVSVGQFQLRDWDGVAYGNNFGTHYANWKTTNSRIYLVGNIASTVDITTLTVKQVLTPAVTGVTITSTADGSTFNWASKEAGFNYNDASGYSYRIDYNNPYKGKKLTVKDSTGKALVGYVKAAGTGETFSTNKITNGTFDSDITGWTNNPARGLDTFEWDAGKLKAVSNGSGAPSYRNAYSNTFALTAGQLLYIENNLTVTGSFSFIGIESTPVGSGIVAGGTLTRTTNTNTYYRTVITSAAGAVFNFYGSEANTSAFTVLLDDVSVKQVLTPSTTGVTITSTADGTTYNWASKEAGFNYNDASGYTYKLERERSLLVQEFIRGFISSWELSSDNQVRISVKNEAMLWAKKTLRIHSSSCPWVFKGTECGYSGTATWCDRNYARCGELLNTDNYGGFRFLPSIMEKEIWWGRQRR